MNQMKQAHFFSLPTQGNIYTITHLQLANNISKLLVASLKRQVFSFEYPQNASGVLEPTAKEISFAYIPNGAEIISLDAFNKSQGGKNDFVIGITIIKSSMDNNSLETFLNIYSDEEFNIDNIAQNCLCVELNFIPYHLTHTDLISWENDQQKKEKVFVLSGSDNKVHIFQETAENHNFKEIDCESHFPEFYNPPAVVTWICVYYINDNVRISGFGCENGYLRLVKVNTRDNSIIFNQSTQFISAISQIKLYPSNYSCLKPKKIVSDDIVVPNGITSGTEGKSQGKLDLLVVNSILPAVHFSNVTENALRDYKCLRRKDTTSVSMCSAPADIDFDGNYEIMIGNSLEEIMLYKPMQIKNSLDYEMKLIEVMKLVGPIFHLLYLDITGDGVKELIVFTMKGLYIYQHDQSFIEDVLRKKVEKLTIPNLSFQSGEN